MNDNAALKQRVIWQNMSVHKMMRAERLGQRPAIVWFTGLSGSGKSTSANALEKALFAKGYCTYVLDGDNLRHGLCKDLGFSDADRVENVRRVGEVAKLMVDAGQIVLTSFISPFQADRDMVRSLVGEGEFIEVFVNTSLTVCEQRDTKGLYKKARNGEIKQFTGISSPYEAPQSPDIVINTATMSGDEVVDYLVECLRHLHVIT